MMALIGGTVLQQPETAWAQQSLLTNSSTVGGTTLSYNPSVIGCLPHTVMFDVVTRTVMGLIFQPGASVLYRNFDLATPGKFLLGERFIQPVPCLVPYPVYFIKQIGTS